MTASKAIIEKEYQPRVIVTKTGPNPFNKFTDQELEEYRKEVELKQKGQDGKRFLTFLPFFCFIINGDVLNYCYTLYNFYRSFNKSSFVPGLIVAVQLRSVR